MELVDQSSEQFMGVTSQGRMTRESPGAGRAKLRLSRGLPRCHAHDVTPMELVDQSSEQFMGGHVTRQDDPGSPGSGRSLTLPPALPRPVTSPPMELVDQSSKQFMGGHVTRQDDAGSPGSDGASPISIYLIIAIFL